MLIAFYSVCTVDKLQEICWRWERGYSMGRESYETKNDISAETHFFHFRNNFFHRTIDKRNVPRSQSSIKEESKNALNEWSIAVNWNHIKLASEPFNTSAQRVRITLAGFKTIFHNRYRRPHCYSTCVCRLPISERKFMRRVKAPSQGRIRITKRKNRFLLWRECVCAYRRNQLTPQNAEKKENRKSFKAIGADAHTHPSTHATVVIHFFLSFASLHTNRKYLICIQCGPELTSARRPRHIEYGSIFIWRG